MLITNVYVDGFNLYYGALRNSPYRWLNLETLCQLLLPKNVIGQIKYFTALVSARPTDPHQPVRQQLYLRALATLPKVSVHLGHFLTHDVTMALVVPPGQPQKYAKVIKTEEKGSDVNLATHCILNPHPNPSRAILPHVDFIKQIRPGVLNAAQFPPTLRNAHGKFTRPPTW